MSITCIYLLIIIWELLSFPEFYDSEMGMEDQPPISAFDIEGEEELERLSEAELLALGTGPTSENWSTRTNEVLRILKNEFENKVWCILTLCNSNK